MADELASDIPAYRDSHRLTRIIHDSSSRNRAVALRDGHAEPRGLTPFPASARGVCPRPNRDRHRRGRRSQSPNSTSRGQAASLPAEGLSQQRIRDCSRNGHE